MSRTKALLLTLLFPSGIILGAYILASLIVRAPEIFAGILILGLLFFLYLIFRNGKL